MACTAAAFSRARAYALYFHHYSESPGVMQTSCRGQRAAREKVAHNFLAATWNVHTGKSSPRPLEPAQPRRRITPSCKVPPVLCGGRTRASQRGGVKPAPPLTRTRDHFTFSLLIPCTASPSGSQSITHSIARSQKFQSCPPRSWRQVTVKPWASSRSR